MARLTRPNDDHRRDDDHPASHNTPWWLQLVTELQRNPLLLLVLFTAYLATLTALVLVAGLVGAGLATLIAAATIPATRKIRRRTSSDPPASAESSLAEPNDNNPDGQ